MYKHKTTFIKCFWSFCSKPRCLEVTSISLGNSSYRGSTVGGFYTVACTEKNIKTINVGSKFFDKEKHFSSAQTLAILKQFPVTNGNRTYFTNI